MDLNSDAAELLDESYSESQMAVEYIDSICMNTSDAISDEETTDLTLEDGSTIPITLVLSEEGASSSGDGGIELTAKDLDLAKDALNIINNNSQSRFISENSSKQISGNLYTIHFADGDLRKSVESQEDLFLNQNEDASQSTKEDISKTCSQPADDDVHGEDSLRHQSELHAMETTTRLEEFMDVVTTYKCKFCRFSCPWKSGLMSHIRNCHIEAKKKKAAAETEVHNYALAPSENQATKNNPKRQELEEHGYSQSPDSAKKKYIIYPSKNISTDVPLIHTLPIPPPIERNVFLCGQCSEGFEFLDDCKTHMIKAHNLRLSPAKSTKLLNVPRKRGRPRIHPRIIKPATRKISTNNENKDSNALIIKNGANVDEDAQVGDSKSSEQNGEKVVKRKRALHDNSILKPFKCPEKGCGYRFSALPHLHYHMSCHSYTGQSYVCPNCGDGAENWRSLSVHLWKEHAVDVDLYKCKECSYRTYSSFKLENHRKIHSDERSFICDICNKGFKQHSQLRNHAVIHSVKKNMTEKRWYSEQKCEICFRTFSDSKCLKKHQQAVHSKLKPFVCTFCGHTSARKAMLQLHMRQHTGEKPFLCDHCEYRTGDHNSLRRHRMRHTGTKPYKCPHCPYACIQAISYKTHLKNKHPGQDGLYACSLCHFRSVSKENYFNHMSDHRRGAIPTVFEGNDNAVQSASQPPQVQLPEATLQQLEDILPGNITAAQIIFSCLNALSQESGTVDLPPGVIASAANDGSQTITIQIPSLQENNSEQYCLTVEQDSSAAGIILPPDCKNLIDSVGTESENTEPVIVIEEESDSLDSNVFANASQDAIIPIAEIV